MKRLLSVTLLLLMVSCSELTNVASKLNEQTKVGVTPKQQLTTADIVSGLKEALRLGSNKSTSQASQVDGFYKDSRLFIPFPSEAEKVKNTLLKAGFSKQVDEFTLTLNRAAEEASKTANPIIISAITNMTITDALSILKGDDTAATDYLRRTTSNELTRAFSPIVKSAIDKVNLTRYWEPIATTYNKLTFLTGNDMVNPNLEEYITQKTIDGLFVLIADEEKNIRNNPAARVSDILIKVFGK